MRKIGIVVAIEIEAIREVLGLATKKRKELGYNIYEYFLDNAHLIVITSGAGEIAAAAATQHLISKYDVELIINFGLVGGINYDMKVGTTSIVENVVHYDYDITAIGGYKIGQYFNESDNFIRTNPELVNFASSILPELKVVNCASADKFVEGFDAKTKIANDFNCQICDMEGAGILRTANKNNVPCLMMKGVSDGVEGGIDEFSDSGNDVATICFEQVMKVIREL